MIVLDQTKKVMKRSFYLLALIYCVFACSEPDEPVPIFANSPTCAYFSTDYVDGKWVDRYYFFDLNHAETKDKKYFVAEFMYKTRDTMRVVSEPQSVDNLGSNFPPEIMDYPGYGWAKQWKNPSYLLKVDGFSGSFYKNPIPSNPASNLYFLNQSQYVGAMAGKWPNAYMGPIRIPDGVGGHYKYNDTYFYFKHGLCFNQSLFCPAGDESNPTVQNFSLKSINAVILDTPYDWETVEAGFSSIHSYGIYYPQHYFLDFKKWHYFVWTEGCDNDTGSCFYRTIEFGDYKSLDNLLKWPEGWGKP